MKLIIVIIFMITIVSIGFVNAEQSKYCNGQEVMDILNRYHHPNGSLTASLIKRPLYPDGQEIKNFNGKFNYVQNNSLFEYSIIESQNKALFCIKNSGYIIKYQVDLNEGSVSDIQCGNAKECSSLSYKL